MGGSAILKGSPVVWNPWHRVQLYSIGLSLQASCYAATLVQSYMTSGMQKGKQFQTSQIVLLRTNDVDSVVGMVVGIP